MKKYIYVKEEEIMNKGRKEGGKYRGKERMFEICKLQLNNNTICKCSITFWLVIWFTTTCGM
jgi:hypothetical protein